MAPVRDSPAAEPATPPLPQTNPAAPEPGQRLALREEFDGDDLDPSRWTETQNGSGSVIAAVDDGSLDLHNYRITAVGPPAGYGRYEARLRASAVGTGTSARLEILGTAGTTRQLHITLTVVPGEVRYSMEGGTVYVNGTVEDDTDAFSVVAVDWSPQGVVFSVDGRVVAGGPDDLLPDPQLGPATLQLVSEGLPLEVDWVRVTPT